MKGELSRGARAAIPVSLGVTAYALVFGVLENEHATGLHEVNRDAADYANHIETVIATKERQLRIMITHLRGPRHHP